MKPKAQLEDLLGLADHRLAVFGDSHSDECFRILRPAGVPGVQFPDCVEYPIGLVPNVIVATDAPVCELRILEGRYVVDISETYVPGPGPCYFRESFPTLPEAIAAIVDCYFGSRIDFSRPDLLQFSHPQPECLPDHCMHEGCSAAPLPGIVFCQAHRP